MAITVDKASIGTFTNDANSATAVLTTNQTVASSAFIVVSVGHFGSSATVDTVVSSPALTWTIDKQSTVTGGRFVAIASAQAPSGLASGSTITFTFTDATPGARVAGGSSFLGVATSSPVDGTPLGTTDVTTDVWSSGNYAIAAGSVIVGACYTPNQASSHTATSGTEAYEAFDVADQYGTVSVYRIESSAGSYAVAGTWGVATGNNKNIAVAYLAAAGDAGSAPTLYSPIRSGVRFT